MPPRRVVETLTLTGTGLALVNVCRLGETEQDVVAGAPEQLRVTVSRVEAEGESVKLYCAVCPALTVCVVEEPADGVRTNSVPVPERGIDCGLFKALSRISMRVAFVPEADGAKVTLIVQFAPGATEEPQLFVSV